MEWRDGLTIEFGDIELRTCDCGEGAVIRCAGELDDAIKSMSREPGTRLSARLEGNQWRLCDSATQR